MQCQPLELSEIQNFAQSSRDNAARGRVHAEDAALLLHEANHRIRNMLAMIEAVMRQTQSESVESYRAKVLSRISGFGQFHEVVGCWAGRNIAFADLLRQTMAPYCTRESQVCASGPDVDLQPGLALALHLVFHELATNASKYGALTLSAGRVTVGWDLHATGGAGPKLAIVWTERGGPEVTYPQRRGFGSRVITRALDGYGEVQLHFHPTGVACYMLVDLERWAPPSQENVRSPSDNDN
jgi:two-component sensor histidine kinase